MSSNQRKRRSQGHPARVHRPSSPRHDRPRINGAPIYDGFVIETVTGEGYNGERDDRVLIGIGPEGGNPVGYLMLCPCDGARDFAAEVRQVAAVAAEHHPTHL